MASRLHVLIMKCWLPAVITALGHMATIRAAAIVDLVESEVTRALELLVTEECMATGGMSHIDGNCHSCTDGILSFTNQSNSSDSGMNQFLDLIFLAIRGTQPIVLAFAADALSICLKTLIDQKQHSLTGMLCSLHFDVMEGLEYNPTKKEKEWFSRCIKSGHSPSRFFF
jgi:hypothetical protein